MGTTSPDALSYPDVGYTSGIRQAVEDLADTTQAALLARAGRTFRPADASALTALGSSYTLAEGDLARQTDNKITYQWNGAAWKGWESPWISQASPFNAGVTVGSGTVSAYYRYVAGAVEMLGKFVFGAGSAFTASVKLSPPVAMDSVYYGTQNIIIEGDVGFQDVGTNYYLGWAFSGASTTALELFVQNAAGTYTNGSTISSTVPMTWATGDTLSWHLSYKAA